MPAVLSVGLLPVLLLALPAAVEEGLAAAAPQGDLALGLLPVVHDTVGTNVFRDTGKHASVGGHPHCRQALERNYFQRVELEQGGVCHEERKALTTRKVVHHIRPPMRRREHFWSGVVTRMAPVLPFIPMASRASDDDNKLQNL